MVIHNILNNNVVIVLDENERETVVCGRGIAFSKKKGDTIDESKVNKIFVLKDKNVNERLKQLLKEVSLEYVEFTDELIEFIQKTLHKKMDDSLLVTLSDHIYTMIQRFKAGVTIRSVLLLDIKRFYREEFEVSLKVLDKIRKKFELDIPEDEAVFITLHIVNASTVETDTKQVINIIEIMKELSNIVKYFFNVEFDEDSLYYYRFMTHIKFFAQRLMAKHEESVEERNELYKKISIEYPKSAQCVEKIATFLNQKYNYCIGKEEKLYLTIHIERVVDKGVL